MHLVVVGLKTYHTPTSHLNIMKWTDVVEERTKEPQLWNTRNGGGLGRSRRGGTNALKKTWMALREGFHHVNIA